ncbi:unnamed protein product [Aphanomyces euteiches]|uniref:Protein kinase domain-containing protein n=1 Tax=Aphanomyces euteiches TaxID=100861 RepID=A0A6G0WQM0_9STRA|nr:hypothetical protein Ae201684_012636 [Aphanomyces euteiches]KAH9101203.1 hypothetical protein Ae201684P_007387 [Aphanomyces euteiches]
MSTPTSVPEDELFDAIKNSDLVLVKRLISTGELNINYIKLINKVPTTPLLWAAGQSVSSSTTRIVEALLEVEGIDVNLPNKAIKKSSTPLIRASGRGNAEVVKRLLKRPDVDCNATAERNESAIVAAANLNRAAIVELLWPRVDDDSKRQCMEAALNGEHWDVVAKMIDLGFEYERMHNGKLLLWVVARYLPLDSLVRMLLDDLPIEVVGSTIEIKDDHDQSWATFLSPELLLSEEVRKEAVIEALIEHPYFENVPREDLLNKLVYAEDEHGRVAIYTTEFAIKEYLERLFYFINRYQIFEGPPMHVSATAVVVEAYDHGICKQVFDESNGKTPEGNLTLAGFIECNQILGRLASEKKATLKQQSDDEKKSDEWREDFGRWAKESENSLTDEEFEKYCELHYSRKLKVAMKFMRNEDEFAREYSAREGLDSKYVVNLLPALEDEVFKEHVTTLEINYGAIPMANYTHVLVMPAADRSLEEIYLKERPSENHVRFMLEEIVLALQYLHAWDICHGDLKKWNIVRVKNQLKLIDFDAAVKMGEPIGAKFSSGILPPEMFYKLKDDHDKELYATYWRATQNIDERLRLKLQPRAEYVVKTFQPENQLPLPYKKVLASPAFDVWSLGCMMFQMWSGEELVSTDINQDVVASQIEVAANWTDNKLEERIKSQIRDRDARDLLLRILRVHPSDRLSLDVMLEEPYFKRRYQS